MPRHMRLQVLDKAQRLRLGDPVGREEGDVPAAGGELAPYEQGLVQWIEVEGLDLDPGIATMRPDKILELLDDAGLERSEATDGDAQRRGFGHRSSQPLTAPRVSPAIRCLCRMKVTTTAGTMINTAIAHMPTQSMVNCDV